MNTTHDSRRARLASQVRRSACATGVAPVLQQLGGRDIGVVPHAFGSPSACERARAGTDRHVLAQRRIVGGDGSRRSRPRTRRGSFRIAASRASPAVSAAAVGHADALPTRMKRVASNFIGAGYTALPQRSKVAGMATARVCYECSCCFSLCSSSKPRRLVCCSASRRLRSTRAKSPTRRSSDVSRWRGMVAE